MRGEMTPLATLAVIRPTRKVEMASLVMAAKLYLEGKKGEDVFCFSSYGRLKYEPDVSLSAEDGMRGAAMFIFGNELGKYQNVNKFFPFLLTCLCGDLLNEKTAWAPTYSSEDCEYAKERNDGLKIRLKKHIDYFSYHDISLSFTKTTWDVEIEGCWRGGDGDSGGPTYQPRQYQGCVKGSRDVVKFHKLTGDRING